MNSLPLTSPGHEAIRWLHGRGNCIAGWEMINIEWLPPMALIVSYQPLSGQQLEFLLAQLTKFPEVQTIAHQQRELKETPIDVIWGQDRLPTSCVEHGLTYQLTFADKQNFGLFLDMKNGRQYVLEHAKNSHVLNLFSYTCAFSVVAMAGGAKSAVNIDMAKRALSVGRDNLRENRLATEKVKFLPHNILKSWGKIKREGPYDLLIIDPPNLQIGSFDIERDYPKIIKRLTELANPAATVMLCLNTPWLPQSFLTALMQEHAPNFDFIEALERPETVLEKDADSGLKVLIYKNKI